MMITLGIHDGHTATACIMRDGKILACVSEERLNRIKEWGGFPKKAILECLRITGIDPEEIDGVGITGLMPPTLPQSYQKPHWTKRAFVFGARVLPERFLQSNHWVKVAKAIGSLFRNRSEIKSRLRDLGIKKEPTFYEHHFLHAASAHYFCPFGNKENLVITCDGSGDAICATVSIGRGKHIERIVEISNYNSIGEFYTQITQFLGMKPMSHEYKVMGLAPYAKEEQAKKTLQQFEAYFELDKQNPLVFKNKSGCWKWQFLDLFRNSLVGHRFDGIARATQTLTEKILVEWIRNCIRKTGIGKLVLSGGVFMNVKANNLILNLPEVEDLFIFPSCGDESLAIAAASVKGLELGVNCVEPLGSIYFGPEFTEEKIENSLKSISGKFNIEKIDDIEEFIGKEIAKGKIIARFSGRMEWGARALGNRSILADPRNPDIIMKINEAVKNRDFWMPFAPTILNERADEYIINPKRFYAPYMIMAFPTTEKAKKELKGALHPYDFTARPQILSEKWNPSYYRILKTFEKETGIGGVLNTSFNLHGEPIVCSPEDAIYTFKNSLLDGLALGKYYISR